MKKTAKQLTVWAITVCLLLSAVSTGYAAKITARGQLSDTVQYTLDSDGLLTISGAGAIPDLDDARDHPCTRSGTRSASA